MFSPSGLKLDHLANVTSKRVRNIRHEESVKKINLQIWQTNVSVTRVRLLLTDT